jgi:transposase InsO family protein
MMSRKEVRKLFYRYKEYAELLTGFKIIILRTDNAKEFVALQKELANIGITVEFTVHYTPEQNGVAERLNRTLITIAKALLFDAQLPPMFWGEAVNTANYLRNRLLIGPDSMSPHEAFTRERPSVSHLRVFGCLAYAY